MSSEPGASAISENLLFNRSEVALELSAREVIGILVRHVVQGVAARSGAALRSCIATRR